MSRELVKHKCAYCMKEFTLTPFLTKVRLNQSKTKNLFCRTRCASLYWHYVVKDNLP